MSIRWKLTVRFVAQLLFAGLLLMALAVLSFQWTMNELTRIEAERQFGQAGVQQLIQTLKVENGRIVFDAKLLEKIRESGGWVQRIDSEGRVTDAFNTPPDVPDAYMPGELNAYWVGKLPFPYRLSIWIDVKDGVEHTLIYGMRFKEEELLQRIAAEASYESGALVIPSGLKSEIDRAGGWVQLLDETGAEIASYGRPETAPDRFTPQEMALRYMYPDRYGARIDYRFDPAAKRTWIVTVPEPGAAGPPGQMQALPSEMRALLLGGGGLLLSAVLVYMLLSFAYARSFVAPLLHMADWLRSLARGIYAEPAGRQGHPVSRNRRGRLKRRFRLFGELLSSLANLSATLRQNDIRRRRDEQMREEWIAGVSHDLKTPLSSIRGYAHMLEAEAYEWTREEVREFSGVIRRKAEYLDNLINDLNLTYRLRGGGRLPGTETADLNLFLAEAVARTAAHPAFRPGSAAFRPSRDPVRAAIYGPWLQRIVDNLVANALLHNPPGTRVDVALEKLPGGGFAIAFRDDGNGMDEETASKLFERYYRGTDTESSPEGSGLGMAITKALVEAMGGAIDVATAPGEGTTIRLVFPAGGKPAEAEPPAYGPNEPDMEPSGTS